MNRFQEFAKGVFFLSLAGAVVVSAWWLAQGSPAPAKSTKSTSPALVTSVVKEEDLNGVILTADAEKRIGLELGPVVKKAIRRQRVFGGEILLPVGRLILVSAPLSGVLKTGKGPAPFAGQSVVAGQNLFQLQPILTPDGRATLSSSLADVEGQVNNAKTQQDLAKITLDRAKRVLQEGAGSQRMVDEAQAGYELATKTLAATVARKAVLAKAVGEIDAGTAAPIAIDAPENGIVRTIFVQPGQSAPSGAPLFEVADLSLVWIRTPLPVGDWDRVDRNEPAYLGRLSSTEETDVVRIEPVAAPPSANAASATIDLMYRAENPHGKWTPGERVCVHVPLKEPGESLVVPWSAIVFDVHGGQWVYEEVGAHRYSRRRVVVRRTADGAAVLESGPPVGAKIVVAGVQQLFGAETGFIK